jgi:hypothetical protein
MVMALHYRHYQYLNVDDDFLSSMKGAYSTCTPLAYFSNDNNERILRQTNEKLSDGLFIYHNRVVIPRPAIALINALLFEYYNNVGHPNYRHLMASLVKRYWWDKMTLDCKWYCQHYVICNKAKPDRRGGVSLHPLGISQYPWEFVGIDYVTDLPKRGLYGHTTVFIMVCYLTKTVHFVPCHKEITLRESTDLLISNCYRLHGVPKVIVSERDSKFVGKFWQKSYGEIEH